MAVKKFKSLGRSFGCGFLLASVAAALLGLLGAAPAMAHPHVFVDNSVIFVFDGSDLAGVRVHWVFDDMFGTMIREDFDADGDGTFSEAEIQAVKVGAFDNLRNFDYFTFIEVDGKSSRVQQVEGFRAGFCEDKLFYDFFVPCRVSGAGGRHRVLLSLHDPEYYADVYTPEDAVPGMENAAGVEAQVSVFLNSERTYSTFQVWTPEITLTFGAR